jgi:malate synthase
VRQAEIDAGKLPDFLPGTRELRESDWIIAELPEDLQDRRVELLGAAELQTIVDALNSGARVFIADFEDRLSPTWHNVVSGQMWLREAVLERSRTRRPTARAARSTGITRRWPCARAAGICREKHLLIDGEPAPGALVDFGLYFFHNAHDLDEQGSGPVLLAAQAREPPRGAPVDERVRIRGEPPRAAPIQRQGDCADRDRAGRVSRSTRSCMC